LKLLSFSGNHGEKFLCTTRPVTSIDRDPRAASNQPGGSTQWCGCGTVENGCSVNIQDSTAVMINFTNLPASSDLREVHLTYSTAGNTLGNLYTSDTGVGVSELSLAAVSNPATVRVRLNPNSGIIGDRVWHDLDEDGVQDPSEPGIAGVTVTLYSGDAIIGTTQTDADGYYRFTNLSRSIDYYVTVNVPSGYGITSPDRTTDDKDSDLNPETGRTHSISIAMGDDLTVDIGLTKTILIPTIPPPNPDVCAQSDITSKIFALDGVASRAARITNSNIKKIIKRVPKKDKKTLNALKALVKSTDSAGVRGWQFAWSIDTKILSCPAQANCTVKSFASNKLQVEDALKEVHSNSKQAIKIAKKLKIRDKKISQDLNKLVTKAIQDGYKLLDEVPNNSYTC